MKKIELQKPTLIKSMGTPSVGKSTTARNLAPHVVNSFVADKDELMYGFLIDINGITAENKENFKPNLDDVEKNPFIPMHSEYYKKNVQNQVYNSVLYLARTNLKAGKNPILDAPYLRPMKFGYFDTTLPNFMRDVDYTLKILLNVCDEDTLRKRMIARASDRDSDKLGSDEAWQKHIQGQPVIPDYIEKYDHLKVDTTKPFNKNLSSIEEYLLK